jgi:hypothetical protein
MRLNPHLVRMVCVETRYSIVFHTITVGDKLDSAIRMKNLVSFPSSKEHAFVHARSRRAERKPRASIPLAVLPLSSRPLPHYPKSPTLHVDSHVFDHSLVVINT